MKNLNKELRKEYMDRRLFFLSSCFPYSISGLFGFFHEEDKKGRAEWAASASWWRPQIVTIQVLCAAVTSVTNSSQKIPVKHACSRRGRPHQIIFMNEQSQTPSSTPEVQIEAPAPDHRSLVKTAKANLKQAKTEVKIAKKAAVKAKQEIKALKKSRTKK